MNPAAGSNSADLVSVTSYLRALYPGLVPGNSTYTANPNLGKSTFSGTLLLTAVPAGKYYLDLNVTTAAYPYHWKGMFSFQVMALPLTVGNGVSNMTTIQSATPQAAPMLATAAVAEPIRVDSYMVLQDGRAELDLTQADGSAPSEVSKPKHGALTGKGQGRYVYTPKSGYCGADEFSYVVRDGQQARSSKVSLQVAAPAAEKAKALQPVSSSVSLTSQAKPMKAAAQAATPKINWQGKVDVAVMPPRLDRKDDWLLEVGREKPAAQQSLGEKTGLIVRFEK